MAEKQRERLRPRHGHVCRVVEQDAVEWATATGEDREWEGGREGGGKGGGKVRGPATSTLVVLALEVLDNLPHDKVLWTEEGGEWRLRECVVRGNENTENYREHHRALADERIALLLQLQPALARRIDPREQGVDRTLGRWQRSLTRLLPASLARTLGGDRARPCAAFVPTGMVDFVEGLCTAFPRRHHFLFADFDSLPPPALEAPGGEEEEAPDLRALNPPLVTSRDPATGQHRDHPSYLSHKGSADIFFPVDFALLQEVYRFFASRADRKGGGQASVRVLKSARFLERYGEEGGQGTCTRSGYNPMLEDFLNTCFFVAEAKDPSAREGRSRRATPRSRR
ncbi:Putative S-adenosyl-L-methionine-dependent methyltransferase MidA [Nannochloropsis gaditana]|uniref:Protein arginine methyltransferase NDUFAF7 n=1 Tax=Nannochloropsis gaditana TaxID=72520 RepID=W7TI39_9STRA|nr:Putative S-adenosyl-L-methionine-dependent methyltransferase MidA [Nannochloropsis gaditana]